MREVLVIARCDSCGTKMETADEPLPKWVVNGVTYRPELCDECLRKTLAALEFLENSKKVQHRSTTPRESQKGRGKYARIHSPCPACQRSFATPAGLSMHITTAVKSGDKAHKPFLPDKKEPKPASEQSRLDCRFCGKKFGNPSGRAGHEVSSHPVEWKKWKGGKQ